MENFFFCARNAEDYLKPLPVMVLDGDKFLDEPEVQKRFNLLNSDKHNNMGDKLLDAPVTLPARADVPDLKFDFNWGLRLEIPAGNCHVKISDFDSGAIYLDRDISERRIISVEKYFIRWHIEIYLDGRKIFTHTLNLRDREVLIHFPKIGMGDIISMLPYVEEFRRRNGCRISVLMPEYLREFTKHVYPKFLHVETIDGDYYAKYQLSMPMNDSGIPMWQTNVKNYPMGRMAGVALGSNKIAQKNIFHPTKMPVTEDPYVCIAVQASNPKKSWLYPGGWDIVIDYLKDLGLRVFCIDRDKVCSLKDSDITIKMPEGAEDFTGNRPIMDRANMLYHAEFFIGMGSGLAWIADAVNCPTVLISGFSQDWAEFYTPYRVINRLVCHGCFNDVRTNFIKKKCPYHEGTPRELECQKSISPKQVIAAINKLLGIGN